MIATLNPVGARSRTVTDCGVRSDEELIAACRRHEDDAWAEVFERYHRLVRSIARSYGATEHDAEEIVQVSFSVLFDSIERIRPDSHLAAWLSTIARRHTWRLLEKRRRTDVRDIPDEAITRSDVDDHAERSGDDELVRAALRSLSPRQRALMEALYLRADEPSYAEISAELGIPVGSIGPTRARCLERLRAFVEDARNAETAEQHADTQDTTGRAVR